MPKSKTYDEFVEKFKPKLTTDDCFTPPEVYDEVLRFAREIADIDGRPIVRPFWPGGDFERFDYPEGCVVVDNPPFSIYARIVRWYLARGIRFLLFAPTLTQAVNGAECCYITSGAIVTYANGAKVATSFTTNLLPGLRVWVCPEISQRIKAIQKQPKKTVKAYRWPTCLTTLANLHRLNVELKIPAASCAYVRNVGVERHQLFGTGFLLSEKAAAEKANAEKAAAEKANAEKAAAEKAAEREKIPIILTDEELAIVAALSDPAGAAHE